MFSRRKSKYAHQSRPFFLNQAQLVTLCIDYLRVVFFCSLNECRFGVVFFYSIWEKNVMRVSSKSGIILSNEAYFSFSASLGGRGV